MFLLVSHFLSLVSAATGVLFAGPRLWAGCVLWVGLAAVVHLYGGQEGLAAARHHQHWAEHVVLLEDE